MSIEAEMLADCCKIVKPFSCSIPKKSDAASMDLSWHKSIEAMAIVKNGQYNGRRCSPARGHFQSVVFTPNNRKSLHAQITFKFLLDGVGDRSDDFDKPLDRPSFAV